MDEQKPGTTIAPQGQQPAAPIPPTPPPQPAVAPKAPETEPTSPPQPSTDDAQPLIPADNDPAESVSWTSSEFITHEKSPGWYVMLGLGSVVLSALIYLLTRDKFSTVVILLVAIVFGIFANRKPRVLDYKLDGNGITISSKFYSYNEFRSFSIVSEGATSGISLLPLKRFMPPLTIYYDPKDEDKIADILADRLPLEHRPADMVDRFMHRIRF